jgi:hypothetical protein
VIKESNRLHEECVLVPAEKVCYNIVFVCKAHYYQCIVEELLIIINNHSTIANRTYSPSTFSKDGILQNHVSVLIIFNIPVHVVDDYELPYLYWIPKLHKTPYKDTMLVPKMFYEISVITPHKNTNCREEEASRAEPQYMPEMGLIKCGFSKQLLKNFFPSNLQHQNLWFYNNLYDHTS